MTTLKELVETMKAEILEDVEVGVVPNTVSSFAELHDHVDANCYAGLCDDQTFEALVAKFVGPLDDPNDGMPQMCVDLLNDAQNEVDAWIKKGGLK